MNSLLQCVAVNLPFRTERRSHLNYEFDSKDGLKLKIKYAVKHSEGRVSLWLSIKEIINEMKNSNFFILCEDDHQFTKYYSFELLQKCINEAQCLDADILSGGISWFKTGVQISKQLFWIDEFSGLQFTIIFKKFYQKIIDANFTEYDKADYKLSELTAKKFVISPFISIQKDFGYSDVTRENNKQGKVQKLFDETFERFELLRKVKQYYSKKKAPYINIRKKDITNVSFPFYILKKPEQTEPFCLNNEFAQKIINVENEDRLGEWKALCSCITTALNTDDDFIMISYSTYNRLSGSYRKTQFIRNLITAGNYGCELLLGNIEMFNHAVPVTENLFWIDSFSSSSFIVLYSSIYQKILTTMPTGKKTDIYNYLSYITSHKMALYPFIMELGINSNLKRGFQEKGMQLSVYQSMYRKYLRK